MAREPANRRRASSNEGEGRSVMGRLVRIAVAMAAAMGATVELQAQGPPASPASPVSPRPFKRVFDKPVAVPEMPIALRQRLEKRLKDLPAGTRCDILVVPADPRLDPRIVVEPPDPRQFSLRMVPTDRFCR
jgi:hypothetical protein